MATEASATATAWTPSTTIMDMPNEILRGIFLSIDGEFSRTLWSLALTCRHLRNIVEEHCEPEYNIRGRWIEDPFVLMERFKAQPYLRNVIRVARMTDNHAEHSEFTEEELQAFASSLGLEALHTGYWTEWGELLNRNEDGPTWLAALLPRIETIELSTTAVNRRPNPFRDPSFITLLDDPKTRNVLQSHGFRDLRSLALLYSPYITGNPLNPRAYYDLYDGILKLPNLRTVRLDNVMFNQEGWSESFTKTSLVKELHIHMY